MVTRFPVVPAKEFDASYANLAEQVNCSSSPSVLDCLRTRSVDDFRDVFKKRPSGIPNPRQNPDHLVQDDDFYYVRPSEAVDSGKIARVPTIIGGRSVTDHSFRVKTCGLIHLTLW
jgi:hypothetical protein